MKDTLSKREGSNARMSERKFFNDSNLFYSIIQYSPKESGVLSDNPSTIYNMG